MHQQAGQLIPVAGEAEQYADTHIVAAAFLGAVHRLRVPGIVALGTGRMQFLVLFLVIGFLEKDVGADAGGLQFPVALHIRGGDIHIHPADGITAFLDRIDGPDGFQNVFQGVVNRVLAGFHRQALVAGADEGANLVGNLFLGQFPAGDGTVLGVVRAINTAVYTVIGQVQRREQDNAVAIKTLFDFCGQGINLFFLNRIITIHQDGSFAVGKPL